MARRPLDASSTDPVQVMTVDQVAAYLQLNRLTVYRYIREGKIPAARIGKLYRILKPDVDGFLDARKIGDAVMDGPGGRAAVRRRHEPAAARPPVQAQARRPRYSAEAYFGPQWRDQMKEREQRERDRDTGYPIEWAMRGLH